MVTLENRPTVKIAVSGDIVTYYSLSVSHCDDERDKTVFHNTTPDLQEQDHILLQDQHRFYGLDWSCPKTDGLRPHHSPITCYK